MELKVISADDHIFEAPDAYQKRMPEELKDAAPRVVTSADGIDTWVCDWEARLVVGGTGDHGLDEAQDHYSNVPLKDGHQAMPRGFHGAGEPRRVGPSRFDRGAHPRGRRRADSLPPREIGSSAVPGARKSEAPISRGLGLA